MTRGVPLWMEELRELERLNGGIAARDDDANLDGYDSDTDWQPEFDDGESE